MWIVALALRRPVTIIAMAALMMLFGLYSFFSMSKDIFPAVNIPEVNLVWYYPGMSAPEIEKRIVNITERATSQTVTGVDHIESNSFAGIGLIKVMAVRQLSGEPGVIHRIPGFPQSRFIDGDNRTSQVAGDPLRTCRARVHVPPSTGH